MLVWCRAVAVAVAVGQWVTLSLMMASKSSLLGVPSTFRIRFSWSRSTRSHTHVFYSNHTVLIYVIFWTVGVSAGDEDKSTVSLHALHEA